ncbi:MAG TPA: protein kinase [Polyangiaceae bacterium]|jgi:serine/threonine-protein kinase
MPQDRARAPYPSQPLAPTSGSDPDAKARAGGAFSGGTYFLGRYRVVDEIGVGGMASVHLSRMDGPGGFQKWVAIKRIHPHLVEDESFVNMFLDEARVAARISHPNVATVFELGKHEDTYWIAMEYLHGEPLREVMRRTEELGQPMPPEIACRVIADAAEGLHAAHELLGKNGEKLGLVHRDVTPHNLFVTYDGNTKVVDFGIAKFSSRMANTRAGTLKGKLAYMSPEQVAGEPIDRRTDVFALGVVLWELTTGQRLFRMESDLDTLAKVQECNVPRPSTIVRGYPIDLEKIVMKALAKTKNERYRTSREFSRALQSLLMRRGLFIASDEVAAYMVSIFGDRIQKREAHLRWAAEVTQTVDIDKLKGVASPWQNDDGSILTYNSEVQASQPSTARGVPRPAAGAPAAAGPPSGPPTARPPGHKNTLRLGQGVVASPPAPAPVPRPASLARPVDPVRSEDPPTLARPRARSDSYRDERSAPEDEFDDVGDTIVSDSIPLMEELRRAPPTPAAGLPPPLGVTLTQAASPAAMAVAFGPSAVPPRLPTQPPMPAVVLPQPVHAHAAPSPYNLASTAVAESHLVFPQPLLRPSLSNEYAPPPSHPAAYGAAAHGPADVQRLFAPPARSEQRTITAQALRKRIPVWAVAVGSAFIGLMAFGFVVAILSLATRSSPTARAPSSSASSASSASAPRPDVPPPAVAAAGPFGSARDAFATAIAAAAAATPAPSRAPTLDAVTPPPAPTAPAPPSPPAAPIPTTNVASLPMAAPTHGPSASHSMPVAAIPQSTAGAGSGTLKVICFPGCDQILDNGSALGPSPIIRRNASIGSHRLKLVWSDASKVVSTIVLADQTATVRENHP